MDGGELSLLLPLIITSLTDCRHLLTGIGAYYYITWGIWLRHCLNGRQDEFELYWPHAYSLPEIVGVDRPKKTQ